MTNDIQLQMMENQSEVFIVVKLANVLKNKNMTQKELSQLTGIPQSRVSEIINNKNVAINRKHLATIAKELKITNISELIDFNFNL